MMFTQQDNEIHLINEATEVIIAALKDMKRVYQTTESNISYNLVKEKIKIIRENMKNNYEIF